MALSVARALTCAVALTSLAASPALAAPIPDPHPTTLAPFMGAPAVASPFTPTVAPQNPFMAGGSNSNIHNDTWMTDAYPTRRGPLGDGLTATSFLLPPALCGSLTFDSAGRLVTVCAGSVTTAIARVVDPLTLRTRARYRFPGGPNEGGPGSYQNFTGGGYFFLDGRDRIWNMTKSSHLFVIAEKDDGRRLVKVGDYDLSSVVQGDERVNSALPDFDGHIWFVSKQNGLVGVLDPKTRTIGSIRLDEEIENSFAIDRDAAYVVSDKRMYRFSLRHGKPHVDWSAGYANTGETKPSQVDAGSGTTPTLMKGGFVAIADNGDPMSVVVYRTARKLQPGQERTVCAVPVFAQGAGATENSLNTSGHSLFVENNYGYEDPFYGEHKGAATTPGFARIDVAPDGSGCRLVWTNTDVQAPTVVPKVSAATGLLYTYERLPAPEGEQPWYWTAIDVHTGRTAWRRYAGSGVQFNNNYSGLALGPDGSAYLGVIGGLLKLRDGA